MYNRAYLKTIPTQGANFEVTLTRFSLRNPKREATFLRCTIKLRIPGLTSQRLLIQQHFDLFTDQLGNTTAGLMYGSDFHV